MRERIHWNNDWEFTKTCREEFLTGDRTLQVQAVRLPHTVEQTPLQYFDEERYQLVSGYRRWFVAAESWRGRRVVVTFEGAAHVAEVFLNGEKLAEHRCGYTAFSVELTKNLNYGEENLLAVRLDSRETLDIPPFGYVVDYLTFGGLYREVTLEITEQLAMEEVFVHTKRLKKDEYRVGVEVTLSEPVQEGLCYRYLLRNQKEECVAQWQIEAKKNNGTWISAKGIREWSPERPALYWLRTELWNQETCVDCLETRIGFREAWFREDGFYLNGTKRKLRGLNRHQSFPYVGYAMPASLQRWDAELLKRELSVNAVRTSHYPQSRHFVDRCDELGLFVFTEIPGWQHIGGADWKEQAVRNTEEMVRQYRNHPSVILWGVRINESEDDDALYRKTNEAAHRLDDTRQTSGVRCNRKSHLLEDVYAYNDFLHDGTNAGCLPKKAVTSDETKGYLISEYNGHMFPTKAYDAEDHQTEHLLRHARVMDAYYAQEDIAGGFGWCMFDYQTHKDFGSGDRVCYHGVMDQFRNRKPAAYVYASQQQEEPVLFVTSAMDIGEHPACLMKDVYAVTNADSVRVYKNGVFVREFTGADTPFKALPHGPIRMDDFIGDLMMEGEGFDRATSEDVKKILMAACKNGLGHLPASALLLAAKCMVFRGMRMQDAVELFRKYIGNWGGTATEYRFDAVKDGEVVASVEKRPAKSVHLETDCSHTTLVERETYDVAAIRIRAVSDAGNLLSFSQLPLEITVNGGLEVIGPQLIVLQGGMGGTYVKTCKRSGTASVTIRGTEVEPVTITFHIEQ